MSNSCGRLVYAYLYPNVVYELFDYDKPGKTEEGKVFKNRIKDIMRRAEADVKLLYESADEAIPRSLTTTSYEVEKLRLDASISALETGKVTKDIYDSLSKHSLIDGDQFLLSSKIKFMSVSNGEVPIQLEGNSISKNKSLEDLQHLNLYIQELNSAINSLVTCGINSKGKDSLTKLMHRLYLEEEIPPDMIDRLNAGCACVNTLEGMLTTAQRIQVYLKEKITALNDHPLQRARDHAKIYSSQSAGNSSYLGTLFAGTLSQVARHAPALLTQPGAAALENMVSISALEIEYEALLASQKKDSDVADDNPVDTHDVSNPQSQQNLATQSAQPAASSKKTKKK